MKHKNLSLHIADIEMIFMQNTFKIIARLRSMENRGNKEGMAKFGINAKNAFGISVFNLRKMAKEIGKNHELSQELWESGFHEARILACFIAEPVKFTEIHAEKWIKDVDSWDICDQLCGNVLYKTRFAYSKVFEWSERKEEFVKRAGFALIASLAVHDKKANDSKFIDFLPVIQREAYDERNYVKKAVNWALRQIGKRNERLNKYAIKTAENILKLDVKSAKWIASNALTELKSNNVQNRLK